MAEYFLTEHARLEMKRRRLPEVIVRSVLAAPEQRVEIRQGRVILQSRVEMESPPKTYLLRIFVDVDREPPEVVTVYRTSKISKYWREDR
jgi:hypothetical protein